MTITTISGQFANAAGSLLASDNYRELFSLLAIVETVKGTDKYDIHHGLAIFYPTFVEIVHSERSTTELSDFFYPFNYSDETYQNFWQTMLWINNSFINAIGCDCSKPIDLFSDSSDTNYNHHCHEVFRRWAYAHMTARRRSQLIIPLQCFSGKKF